MKIRTIKYYIRQGFTGLAKNRLMSFASIATVAACTFIFVIAFCLGTNLNYILEQIEDTVGISVFLGDDLTDTQIERLKEKIEQTEHVSGVEYFSKEDALNWAKQEWGQKSLLKGLRKDDNPFPRSFDISLDKLENQEIVIELLEGLRYDLEKELVLKNTEESFEEEYGEISSVEVTLEEVKEANIEAIGKGNYEYKGIEAIRHAQKESAMLTAMNTALRIASIIIILIMSIIAIGIIMNTIKLAVFIRKNEINIMKYIGATDWFIRWPFIVEGVIIGIIGAVIPCLVCWLSYDGAVDALYQSTVALQSFVKFRSSSEIFGILLPMTLLLGALLGAVGSITSIRKHLNV